MAQLFALVHSLEILAYFKVILKKLHHHKLDILSFTQSAVPGWNHIKIRENSTSANSK